MDTRWMMSALGAGLGVMFWALAARRSPDSLEPERVGEVDVSGVFDELPETDSPEVVRLLLAWKLAERANGPDGHGPMTLERRLDLFGNLYRRISRATG